MTDLICTCHFGMPVPEDADWNPHGEGCPLSEPILHHMDTTDWTPEDHWENSIDGFWCPHAEEAKDHYADGCSICDKED